MKYTNEKKIKASEGFYPAEAFCSECKSILPVKQLEREMMQSFKNEKNNTVTFMPLDKPRLIKCEGCGVNTKVKCIDRYKHELYTMACTHVNGGHDYYVINVYDD